MHFTKMHGAGNDFIIINNIDGAIPESVLPVSYTHLDVYKRQAPFYVEKFLDYAIRHSGSSCRYIFMTGTLAPIKWLSLIHIFFAGITPLMWGL